MRWCEDGNDLVGIIKEYEDSQLGMGFAGFFQRNYLIKTKLDLV